LPAAWPTALVAFPVALPTALVALPTASVALSAALPTAATGVGFRELADFGERLDLLADVLLDLLDEPRERAGDFFEPLERFAEAPALAWAIVPPLVAPAV
jgi:hypothetical protein